VAFDGAKLVDELTRDEGLRCKAYRDSKGYLTIGIGRNLDAKGISPSEARMLCQNDVAEAAAALDAHLPWWTALDPVRARVLVNMTFNMGIATVLTFKATLADVQAGNYVGAANGMLNSLWATQVGARAQRLAKMMATGSAVEGIA
jgi:lysozyme